MPPARRTRTPSAPAAKGAQKTLSFGSKVSKPAAAAARGKAVDSDTSTKGKKAHPLSKTIDIPHETRTEPEPQPDSRRVDVSAAVALAAKVPGDKVTQATKVSDAQIQKYWREREGERMTTRVHQEEIGVEEKILRLFDMSSQYGPAIGIARMRRWSRAQKLGLQPPMEVLAVLLREEKKGNGKIERAHVDELMSSKFVVGEAA